MKQKKKAKICFVIYIAGFFFKFFFCYEVIAKQKKTKLSRHYYSCRRQAVMIILGAIATTCRRQAILITLGANATTKSLEPLTTNSARGKGNGPPVEGKPGSLISLNLSLV